MKKSLKKLTLSCLSGMVLVSMTMPVLGQDYADSYANDYDYSYDSYDSDYNYDQQSNQSQPQNYQQDNNNYSKQNRNYNTVPNQYTQNNNQYSGQENYSPQPANNYNRVSTPNYNNNVPVQNNYNLPPLQGRVVTVPPGTMLPGATTNRTLSSKNLRTGDRVSVLMNSPFYYNGTMVLPAGTSITGTVVMAESAGRAGKNGKLMVVFNQATTPSGQTVGLSGKIATDDGSGILKGGTGMDRAKEVVKDTAVGSGIGALLGTIFGAVSGGSSGKGAAIGTAIGGGTGVAKTIYDKGRDVVIEAGEKLDIILDSELRTGSEQDGASQLPSVSPNNNYNYNNNYEY